MTQAPSPPNTDPAIAANAIRRELARILASPGFLASPQMSNLLRFVVEEALAGRQEHIKQYTIAVRALARPTWFNPKTDPIVRVSARRLRSLLVEYYQRAGAADRIRIQIPEGRYTPIFRDPRGMTLQPRADMSPDDLFREVQPPRPDNDLSIAVLTFPSWSPDCRPWAQLLAEQLALHLTRDPNYRVLGPWPQVGTARTGSVLDTLGRKFDIRFVLDGSVCACGGDLRVSVRLFDSRTARNLWAESYCCGQRTFEALDEAARRIVVAVAGDWGVIPAAIEQETQDKTPAELTLYEVLLRRNRWIREFSAAALAGTIRSLEYAVQACPDQACHRAWLAWAYLDDYAHGMGVVDNHFARVDAVLKEAQAMDPAAEGEVRCMRAYANFLQRDRAAALREHESAWRANPDEPATNIVFACDACALGDWDRGLTLVRDVIARTPQYPDWLHLLPAVGHYMKGDYEESLAQAHRCRTDAFPWSPLCRAAALGQLGRSEEAAVEMCRLQYLVPEFPTRGPELMRRILYSDRSVKAMLAGLQKAAELGRQ